MAYDNQNLESHIHSGVGVQAENVLGVGAESSLNFLMQQTDKWRRLLGTEGKVRKHKGRLTAPKASAPEHNHQPQHKMKPLGT